MDLKFDKIALFDKKCKKLKNGLFEASKSSFSGKKLFKCSDSFLLKKSALKIRKA